MRETNSIRSCGDVLMVSVVTTGHVTPMMYVANGLMERGITITVVVPEDQRAVVEKNSESSNKQAEGLMSLQLVTSLSKVDDIDSGMAGMSTNLEQACEPFFQRLLAGKESGSGHGPKCIVADQFLGWTQVWANKLKIPRYVSFPSPAAYALTMLCHAPLEEQLEHAPDKEDPNLVFDIPELPVELHTTDLPVSFRNNPDFRAKVVDKSGDSFREAAGILFNTFYELESEAIDGFKAQVETSSSQGKVTRMLPIGPMLPTSFFKEDVFVGETVNKSECLQWLDTRPVSSVLYIAFGSAAVLSPDQIHALAHGLEASQVSFLWILRMKASTDEPGDVSKLLPPGFQARTKDRGFVYTEFAPQLQILSHPATGGFLTHCGWNSSLESICRGVPMVGWPMGAEQGICCRVLVDLKEVAVEIKKELDNTVRRDDVEKAIRLLMTQPEGKKLKQRAVELQVLARAAVAPGGSSDRNFESFVKELLGQK